MSDDILERAKAVDPEMLAVLNWGALRDLISELIAEVERLRAALAHELDLRNRHIESLEARIKELEARIGREQVATMQNREAQLQNVISSQEAYIKLLEAAFLRSNAAMRYYQEGNRGPWPQVGDKFKEPYLEKAREKLERIKEGNG